jgi:fumarylacetoacetase
VTDETHDPNRRSWVPGADGHPDFPIQNLPLGVFAPKDGDARGGVAIGDHILDVAAALGEGLLDGEAAEAASWPVLNDFMALPAEARRQFRRAVSDLLDAAGSKRAKAEAAVERLLHPAADCELFLPAEIGDYTDFYAGIHHAENVGRLFRPDNPLMPNYKYVPIGYHGRASSVRPSGTAVKRPYGQRKRPDEAQPDFGPCRNLDYELELGVWVGPGNELGEPVAIGEARKHLVGLCLLNDWSARDLQAWEYQPLGPFLGKSFMTTISPWVVTAEALEPFRTAEPARPEGDPRPLDYLWDEQDQASGAFDIELEVLLLTPKMRDKGLAAHRLCRTSATNLYWTIGQMLTHHTSNGCDLRPGDLLGTGTISGPELSSCGSLLELSAGGKAPIVLPGDETRTFLQDGDEVIFRARCRREGITPIGFGECRGVVLGGS